MEIGYYLVSGSRSAGLHHHYGLCLAQFVRLLEVDLEGSPVVRLPVLFVLGGGLDGPLPMGALWAAMIFLISGSGLCTTFMSKISMRLWVLDSMALTMERSSAVKNDTEVPSLPALPVLPMRWTYVSGSFGAS